MRTIRVIAPVLNEAENMPTLFSSWKDLAQSFQNETFHFYLVDDGSTDGGKTVAEGLAKEKGLNLTVVRHEVNQGPGAAFGSAFVAIKPQLSPQDLVVTMEGDNTSRIKTLQTMIGRIDREDVDVALASPYAYGGSIIKTSLHRVILSHIANGMIKGFVGIHGIHTMSSFFRCYRGGVVQSLQKKFGDRVISQKGFECMIELLKKTILLQATITEVPMVLDTSLRKGKSKMKVFKTILGYFKVMWAARQWS